MTWNKQCCWSTQLMHLSHCGIIPSAQEAWIHHPEVRERAAFSGIPCWHVVRPFLNPCTYHECSQLWLQIPLQSATFLHLCPTMLSPTHCSQHLLSLFCNLLLTQQLCLFVMSNLCLVCLCQTAQKLFLWHAPSPMPLVFKAQAPSHSLEIPLLPKMSTFPCTSICLG